MINDYIKRGDQIQDLNQINVSSTRGREKNTDSHLFIFLNKGITIIDNKMKTLQGYP